MKNICKAPFCPNDRYENSSYCYPHMTERLLYEVTQHKEVLPAWAVKRCKKHGLLTSKQARRDKTRTGESAYRCGQCARDVKKKGYNPEKERAYRKSREGYTKKYGYLKKFGLTFEEQDALLQSQSNLCAICRLPQRPFKSARSLYLDHCHTTGKHREFLCSDCNSGLGFFKDNTELMNVAIKYLLKHKQEQV